METLRFLMVSTFYPPYHLGGDAVHVQYLAEALAAQGHEVHVEFSPAAYGVKRRAAPAADGEPKDGVHPHPVTRPSQPTSPAAAYLLGKSRVISRAHERLVREIGPDVIHLHNISLLGLGVLEGNANRPLLYTAHDYWFRCPRSDLLKYGRAPCGSPSCLSCMVRSRRVPPPWRGADIAGRMKAIQCVIAPSRFMQGLAEASFRCPVVHIPNFIPDRNPGGALEPEARYLLYVGVLEAHKGIGVLAQAVQDYAGTRRFVIVGRGSEEGALRRLAERVGPRLEVRSWVSQSVLTALYRQASALLVPSIWFENSPLAAIEALAWGVPLLASSRGGVPELLHEGMAGYAFEPNPAGLLGAIRTLEGLEDQESVHRSARAAYEAYHRPTTYLLRYLSTVQALLRGAAPDGRSDGSGAQDPSVPILLRGA